MPLYLKFGKGPDIKGEVTETSHKDWIAIDSVSFGTGRSTNVEVGSGQEKRHRDQPTLSDMQISRSVDKASPLLFNQSVAGAATEVTIHCLRPANKQDAPPLLYLEFNLRNCLISSYSVGGGGGGASESFALNFTAINYTYTPFDDKDSQGEATKGFFDLVTAKCVPWK